MNGGEVASERGTETSPLSSCVSSPIYLARFLLLYRLSHQASGQGKMKATIMSAIIKSILGIAILCILTGCADTDSPLTEKDIEALIDASVAEEIGKTDGDALTAQEIAQKV